MAVDELAELCSRLPAHCEAPVPAGNVTSEIISRNCDRLAFYMLEAECNCVTRLNFSQSVVATEIASKSRVFISRSNKRFPYRTQPPEHRKFKNIIIIIIIIYLLIKVYKIHKSDKTSKTEQDSKAHWGSNSCP